MKTTLEDIHRDPAIIDRAIRSGSLLEILDHGVLPATLTPSAGLSIEQAQAWMRQKFAAQDWQFSAGEPMTREQRNARG